MLPRAVRERTLLPTGKGSWTPAITPSLRNGGGRQV
jgi:hypothetical protein